VDREAALLDKHPQVGFGCHYRKHFASLVCLIGKGGPKDGLTHMGVDGWSYRGKTFAHVESMRAQHPDGRVLIIRPACPEILF